MKIVLIVPVLVEVCYGTARDLAAAKKALAGIDIPHRDAASGSADGTCYSAKSLKRLGGRIRTRARKVRS